MKKAQRKALIIGISDYTNLQQLDFCKNDGTEIYEVLSSLGYEVSDKNKLVGEAKGEKVKDAIYDFFDDIRNIPDDTLLFYYSGHGVPDVDGDMYLASSDTDPDKPYRRGFSFEELTKMIQKSISTSVVVILDCCYSGSAKISKGHEEDAAKIVEWKKGIEDSDYDSLRELAIYAKREGFGLIDIASYIRLNNYVQKLGANEDQVESFIANLANSPEPEKLIEVANQVVHLSRSESIPLGELKDHVKHREEEKQRLEEEIKQRRAISDVEIQTINDYKQLKAELNRYHLSPSDPAKLLTVLTNLKGYRYDPKKIVAEFSNIKSIKRRENALQYKCKLLEERMAKCQSVLPLCEQIIRIRIGISELLAFHTAVSEKAETHNLSMESAAYRVIEDIRDYEKLGGMKKQQSDVAMQIYALNQFSTRQNKAIMALISLNAYGITDDEILNMCEFLNRARFESAATIRS